MEKKSATKRAKPLVYSVDDDPRIQKIVELYLTKNGYEVAFASSGEEALSKLDSINPDLILLDVMMPGMTGYEVCAKLQEKEDTAGIPVIFATALGEERDKAKAFALGAVDYLVKPIQKEALLQKIGAALASGQAWKDVEKKSPSSQEGKTMAKDFRSFKEFLGRQLSMNSSQIATLNKLGVQEIFTGTEKMGFQPSNVAQQMAEFLKLPYLARVNSKDVLLGVLPVRFCKTSLVLPLSDAVAGVVFAISNPFDWELMDALERHPGHNQNLRLLLTEPENIVNMFEEQEAKLEGEEAAGDDLVFMDAKRAKGKSGDGDAESEESLKKAIHDLAEMANQAPIIKLANSLLSRAIQIGASDIHLEPRENSLGVRYRVDGMLYEQDSIPKKLQPPVISRFKIMADLNIVERRLPQDGRIRITAKGGRNIDLRVSTLPSRHGEKVVIRILDVTAISLDFESLGFEETQLDKFRTSIRKPNGIVLITGPTGSGKSTTLYTALQALNEPHVNIVTVEDPIEYEIHRVNQVQVHPEAGLTFPAALRSILRQDPDIMMIGEVRDKETMEIAIKSSLTGHLVLSTLHTNDAPSAITRLVDMGSEPYLVAASLEMVVAQRLVRKLCSNCKKPAKVSDHVISHFNAKQASKQTFFSAGGCEICNGTGYKGRLAIEEVMPVDLELRRMITRNAPAEEMRNHAIEKSGMLNLAQSGFLKAARGLTSLEEVMRVAG